MARQYPFKEDYFHDIDTPEKAYWLGFLAADGGINPKNNTVQVNLAGRDIEHLRLFHRALDRNAPIYEVTSNYGTPVARLSIGSKQMVADLTRHGVGGAKSFTITPWETDARHLIAPYWRGVFDGDGSIGKTAPHRRTGRLWYWRVSLSGSLPMARGFQSFVVEHGGTQGSIGPHAQIWKVAWGGINPPRIVANALYADSTYPALARKLALAREISQEH